MSVRIAQYKQVYDCQRTPSSVIHHNVIAELSGYCPAEIFESMSALYQRLEAFQSPNHWTTAEMRDAGAHSSCSEGRLLVVSNRLPITIVQQNNAAYSFTRSSGGLVSSLSSISSGLISNWYGWPGKRIGETHLNEVESELRYRFAACPVWLDDATVERYYNRVSSK